MTKICHFFNRPGGCNTGSSCPLSHSPPLPPPPPNHDSNKPQKSKPCFDFQKKKCLRRNKCPFIHDSSKQSSTDLPPPSSSTKQKVSEKEFLAGVPRGTCKLFWEQGRCKLGHECRHRHDKTQGPIPSLTPRPHGSTSDALVHANSDTCAPASTFKTPVDTQILKLAFQDDCFRFASTSDVYRFSRRFTILQK